jgi:hypothetical protein
MLDATCSHTMQMTQLQSSLMADIDIYYTKSKHLEEEVEKKQETIQALTEKMNILEEDFQCQYKVFAEKEYHQFTTVCTTTGESLGSPTPLDTGSPQMSTSVFLQSPCPTLLPPSSPNSNSNSNNMCDGLTLSSVQLWNENLRQELQRVHVEQSAGEARIESLRGALAQSEEERLRAEEQCEGLLGQVEELVSSKEQVLAVVQRVQRENAELKNSIRRMKHL